MYIVTLFKNNSGRWGVRHPSGRIGCHDWATRSYAEKVAKREGWEYTIENTVPRPLHRLSAAVYAITH